MDWIEKTILSNGGMAACGFTFSAPPFIGLKILLCNSVTFSAAMQESAPKCHINSFGWRLGGLEVLVILLGIL